MHKSSTFNLAQWLLAIAWAIVWSAWRVPAFAQSDSGRLNLVTSPLPINIVTKPGQTVTTDLRIRNAGAQTESLKVGLLKFKAYGDSGLPKLLDRGPGDEYFDWVTFSPAQFNLEPNQWQTVTMKIAVPKTAAFGYYYAVTFSRAGSPESVASGQTALLGSSATLVLLDVDVPGAKQDLQVVKFAPNSNWYEFLPVTFDVTLHNSGNVHTAARGNIFVYNGRGQQVATLDVNAAMGYILPDSDRTFTVTWDSGFPSYRQKSQNGQVVMDAKGNPETELNWDLTKVNDVRFGPYHAQLAMAYTSNNKDVPVEAKTSFWVVPWRILLGALLVVALLGFGLWSMIRGVWRTVRK